MNEIVVSHVSSIGRHGAPSSFPTIASVFPPRSEWLRHLDAVAVLTIFEIARHVEFFGSGFDETEAAVDGEQLRAEAQDGDVDGLAAARAEVVLGCGEHLSAQAGALVGWVDRELPEIAAVSVGLCVDAGEDLAGGILREEDFAFLHHRG